MPEMKQDIPTRQMCTLFSIWMRQDGVFCLFVWVFFLMIINTKRKKQRGKTRPDKVRILLTPNQVNNLFLFHECFDMTAPAAQFKNEGMFTLYL